MRATMRAAMRAGAVRAPVPAVVLAAAPTLAAAAYRAPARSFRRCRTGSTAAVATALMGAEPRYCARSVSLSSISGWGSAVGHASSLTDCRLVCQAYRGRSAKSCASEGDVFGGVFFSRKVRDRKLG